MHHKEIYRILKLAFVEYRRTNETGKLIFLNVSGAIDFFSGMFSSEGALSDVFSKGVYVSTPKIQDEITDLTYARHPMSRQAPRFRESWTVAACEQRR